MTDTKRSAGGVLATGGVIFAGVLLAAAGVFQVLIGIAAIAQDAVYADVRGYVFTINLSGWGWIHLILGVVLIVAGVGVLTEKAWALGTAMVLAVLSAIANFLFIPYYPIWSLVVIALDVLVIWALATRFGGVSVG